MQIQVSWLLQKPTDLDLHCLQRQGISGFSRTRVNKAPILKVLSKIVEYFFFFFFFHYSSEKIGLGISCDSSARHEMSSFFSLLAEDSSKLPSLIFSETKIQKKNPLFAAGVIRTAMFEMVSGKIYTLVKAYERLDGFSLQRSWIKKFSQWKCVRSALSRHSKWEHITCFL